MDNGLQAYFITNMEPIKFWEFMSLILGGLGYERYVYFLHILFCKDIILGLFFLPVLSKFYFHKGSQFRWESKPLILKIFSLLL